MLLTALWLAFFLMGFIFRQYVAGGKKYKKKCIEDQSRVFKLAWIMYQFFHFISLEWTLMDALKARKTFHFSFLSKV